MQYGHNQVARPGASPDLPNTIHIPIGLPCTLLVNKIENKKYDVVYISIFTWFRELMLGPGKWFQI